MTTILPETDIETPLPPFPTEYVNDLEDEEVVYGVSKIQNFFKNGHVFVTGGTGFMGQVLIEKLLRSCPGISTIYILIRPKKGKEVDQRFQELFECCLFDRLKQERPNALHKVKLILGDVGLPGLGISDEDTLRLCRDVTVVFHAAATVRFDEKLRIAVAINVAGTKAMLNLARQMPNLKSMVHISTAYSNCPLKEIDEKFYDPGVEADKLDVLCQNLDDDQLATLLPSLLGKWPNTYAFTKAIAEDCIRRCGRGLPIAVVRPSIVINTAHEPLKGWINNVYGAAGVNLGAGLGLLKSLHCDPAKVAEIVPVDMAINCVIAAAWDVGQTRLNNESTVMSDDAQIYNYVSSCQRPVTWGKYMEYTEVGLETPLKSSIWYYCFTLNRSRWVHNIYVLFLHLLPAIIADTCCRLVGKKPILWDTYKKVHKFTDVIAYFSSQEWKFHNNNVQSLWQRLGVADQKLFHFNMVDFDWKEMMRVSILGMRVYVVKEPIENLEEARRRYRKLKILHYTIVTVVSMILLRGLWWILRLVV